MPHLSSIESYHSGFVFFPVLKAHSIWPRHELGIPGEVLEQVVSSKIKSEKALQILNDFIVTFSKDLSLLTMISGSRNDHVSTNDFLYNDFQPTILKSLLAMKKPLLATITNRWLRGNRW